MFGLIKKKELSAFAERVHNDNALDARIGAPLNPVSYDDHKRAAYWNGYADGSRAFLFALRAFMFGGKKKRERVDKLVPIKRAAGPTVCREFETVVTVQVDEIDKNAVLPEWFALGPYKLGVEDRIRRALYEAGCDDANINVKVQVFMKDEGEC